MKILHVFDHSIPLHSGYTFRSRAILEQQQKLGWQTFHVTSAKQGDTSSDCEEIDNLVFYRSELPRGLLAKLPVFNQWAIVNSLAKRLDEIIPEIKPDIIHAHSPALNGLAALRMAKKYDLPVVYECRAFWEDAAVDHGTTTEGSLRYRLTKTLESYVFKGANAVTTICEGLRQDIISRGINASKITVIPNAVNIEKFSTVGVADKKLAQKLGLENKTVLGFIGSFYGYEGLLLLIEALPAILVKQADVRLLLVGGGFQEQAIKQKTQHLGLEEVVILTGRVPHEQVQIYYNLVDLLVYPRLAMRLTELVTPLKPLEAMAQGRLVLASDVGGHKELIIDGENGYLFPAGNAEQLANKVVTLLADKSAWQQIRQQARIFVEQQRNWQMSVSNYQTIYQSLMK